MSVAALLVLNSACAKAPPLTPVLDVETNVPRLESWMRAPLIVVGQVLRVSEEDKSQLRREHLSIDVQLHKLDLEIEKTIRGDWPEPRMTVFRYGFLGGHVPGNLAVNQIAEGERRVFFIVRSGRSLRLAEDVVAASIVVAAGRKGPDNTDRSANYRIAETLILPGEDLNLDAYMRTLRVQTLSTVPALIGFKETILFLRKLASNPSKEISGTACILVYQLHPFGDGCINELVSDIDMLEHVRDQARETLRLYSLNKSRQVELLRAQPSEWLARWFEDQGQLSYIARSTKGDAKFVLDELAASTVDPVVRRNAERLLQSLDGENAAVKGRRAE